MTSHEDAVARLACAWLLWYPDDRMFERLPDIRAALAELPAQTRDPLTAFLGWLDEQDRMDLAREYVTTFDMRRKACPYLTYWTHGDTRNRGMAILHFKQAYLDNGFDAGDAELADHLAVVLEFAAIGDRLTGDALLAEHVGAIGLLHSALESMGSPYALVVEAVIATLPAITPEIADRMAAIATQGPPSEQVGLEPFTIGTEEVREMIATVDAVAPQLTTMDVLLWDVLPYVTIAVFVVGLIWRYRYDRFGWTTRSSQLYEKPLIRIASPIFHFGILAVLMGHVVGLLIPEAWTDALGVSESTYHFFAVVLGAVAGAATLFGIAMLIYRRRTVGPVFAATTKNDKTMYVFLTAAIILGVIATLSGAGVLGEGHNYREDVSVWFRSIFLLDPQAQLMADTPLAFRVHAVAGMALFIVWPFTRLVHAFSAPVGYVFRPYVVYRDRGPHDAGNRRPRRGWEKVGGP